MRKFLTAALAALTLGGSMAATVPAQAQPHWRGGWHEGWRHHDNDDAAWAIGAGIAGLALGAALADRPHYNHYGYGYGYGPYGGYGPYYGYEGYTCVGHRRVWDPYLGGWIWQRYYYPC